MNIKKKLPFLSTGLPLLLKKNYLIIYTHRLGLAREFFNSLIIPRFRIRISTLIHGVLKNTIDNMDDVRRSDQGVQGRRIDQQAGSFLTLKKYKDWIKNSLIGRYKKKRLQSKTGRFFYARRFLHP